MCAFNLSARRALTLLSLLRLMQFKAIHTVLVMSNKLITLEHNRLWILKFHTGLPRIKNIFKGDHVILITHCMRLCFPKRH